MGPRIGMIQNKWCEDTQKATQNRLPYKIQRKRIDSRLENKGEIQGNQLQIGSTPTVTPLHSIPFPIPCHRQIDCTDCGGISSEEGRGREGDHQQTSTQKGGHTLYTVHSMTTETRSL